jgi:hypothetical protein
MPFSRGAVAGVTTGTNAGERVPRRNCPADVRPPWGAGTGWVGPAGVGTPNGLPTS